MSRTSLYSNAPHFLCSKRKHPLLGLSWSFHSHYCLKTWPLASASPQYPGLSELSIPTSPAPLEVIPPSFPLEINMLFYHKLLLVELPMLLRSPNTSIQLSPTQSPQKQSERFSGNIHSRLW